MAVAKLWKGRLADVVASLDSDDADGPALVTAHNELEGAIAAVLGIEPDVRVEKALFTSVSAGGQFFMLKYKTDAIVTNANDGAGIEFTDGDKVKKLTFVNGEIGVWERSGSPPDYDWTLMFDYETEDEPNLVDLGDCQRFVQLGDREGLVLGVASPIGTDEEEEHFEQVPNTVGTSGISRLIDATDVSDDFKPGLFAPAGSVYNADAVGKAFGVSTDGSTLKPVDLATGVEAGYTVHKKGPVQTLGLVGREGNGSWTTLAWGSNDFGGSAATMVDWNGSTRGAFILEKGLYKVLLSWAQASAAGISGKIMYSLAGNGYKPHISTLRATPVQWFNERSFWIRTDNETVYTNSNSGAPGYSPGPWFICVPVSATVAVRMGHTDPYEITVRPNVSIERIR